MTGRAGQRVEEEPGGEGDGSPVALAVVGPTATGKTRLAIAVARRLDGEIISLDSRQAYRGLEIGSAAPTEEERRAAIHHGVSFLEPDERYGAGRFARLARDWIERIRGRGRTPILAGGTGFFLRALTDPVFAEPEMDPGRRRRLRRWSDEQPRERLRRWTRRLDPALEEELQALDRQRCSRTLELSLLAGRPLTWWQRNAPPGAAPVPVMIFVLELPGPEHRERIRKRAERLLDRGWAEELGALRRAGYGADDPALTALGYGEVARLVAGEADREEVLEEIARSTWKYARRQRTWFRNQVPEDAARLDARRPTADLARRIAWDWRTR